MECDAIYKHMHMKTSLVVGLFDVEETSTLRSKPAVAAVAVVEGGDGSCGNGGGKAGGGGGRVCCTK